MKEGTAFGERRWRWAPFIRDLVGVEHGADVGVTEYVRAFNSLRPDHRIKGERKKEVRSEDREAIYLQVEGKRAPQALNAWYHGKALSYWYAWAGGPLGLYAAGHLADFVGVFACLDPIDVGPHAETVAALINTAYAATYGNALDIPLGQATAMKARGLALPPATEKELDRLKDREAARAVWATALKTDLGGSFDQAWARWSGSGQKPELTRFTGEAHRLALDRSFTFIERVQLVTRALISWVHSEVTPEPPELLFASQDFQDQIAKLDTAGARRARLMFLMYWCGAQLLMVDDWFPNMNEAPDGIAGRPFGTTLLNWLSEPGRSN
ncbi:MAG: hypothetical protein WB681_08450 [Candidatus Cybelea sp.]